jgi:ketosteroid isomerase-like protein
MTDKEKEILSIIQSFNEAFASNDPERYFSFIADDFSLFVPGSPYRIDSKALDRKEFEHSLATGKSKVWLFQMLHPRVQLFGNMAIVSFHSRGALGNLIEESTTVFFKITDVLVKEHDQWKVKHIHVSQ